MGFIREYFQEGLLRNGGGRVGKRERLHNWCIYTRSLTPSSESSGTGMILQSCSELRWGGRSFVYCINQSLMGNGRNLGQGGSFWQFLKSNTAHQKQRVLHTLLAPLVGGVESGGKLKMWFAKDQPQHHKAYKWVGLELRDRSQSNWGRW